ncbi:hypothetical protein EYF80_018906 [Liparis tanakae]|uniref:Uncharacterized protein n=1 Tax=Liparis tanakae TaxID=230148 RepID=A0A4Z2HZC4_9TELE|nr:hypothetical protein EYF80_018906 [Liparis tanakae]
MEEEDRGLPTMRPSELERKADKCQKRKRTALVELFEGVSERWKQRQRDSERKRRAHILTTAASPVPTGAQSSEGS